MKTVRFSEVVKKCGEPSIYLAWVDPARDKTFKRALGEHRVMTLHQELHGGKKDFGSVGLLKDRHAQILLFPKSLRRFSDRKVIAIDYSLILAEKMSSGSPPSKEKAKKQREAPAKSAAPAPRPPKVETLAQKDKVSPPADPGRDASAPSPKSPSVEKILSEVKRAVTELSAGKSVPAYERLKRILDAAH